MPKDRLRNDRVDECHALTQRVFAAMHKSSSPQWSALDLTMAQMKGVMTITAFGALPVGELGRRLGISEPAASLLTDRLEADGLARREHDPHDRRRSLVTPTDAAIELATTLRQGRDEQVRRWLVALAPDELDGLCRGFRGLLRVTDPEGVPADEAGGPEEAATQERTETPRG